MIKAKTRRYSGLISPLSYLIDIAIIIVITQYYLAVYLYKEFEFKHFVTLSVLWIIISVFNRFYYIYRYTNFLKIINLLFNQIVLFVLSLFCFTGIFPELKLDPASVFKLLMPISILIVFVKTLTYYSIKTFRSYFGGNYRKTIIVGSSVEALNLELFFNSNKEAGYLHKKPLNLVPQH